MAQEQDVTGSLVRETLFPLLDAYFRPKSREKKQRNGRPGRREDQCQCQPQQVAVNAHRRERAAAKVSREWPVLSLSGPFSFFSIRFYSSLRFSRARKVSFVNCLPSLRARRKMAQLSNNERRERTGERDFRTRPRPPETYVKPVASRAADARSPFSLSLAVSFLSFGGGRGRWPGPRIVHANETDRMTPR